MSTLDDLAPTTANLVRQVLDQQDQWRHALTHEGPPWAAGWSMLMHPATWYAMLREATIMVDSKTGPVVARRGDRNTFLDIPVDLDPAWPKGSVTLRYEVVVA